MFQHLTLVVVKMGRNCKYTCKSYLDCLLLLVDLCFQAVHVDLVVQIHPVFLAIQKVPDLQVDQQGQVDLLGQQVLLVLAHQVIQ